MMSQQAHDPYGLNGSILNNPLNYENEFDQMKQECEYTFKDKPAQPSFISIKTNIGQDGRITQQLDMARDSNRDGP